MSRSQGLQAWPTPAEASLAFDRSQHSLPVETWRERPPVLISVPEVKLPKARKLARRPSPEARVRVRAMSKPSGAVVPRRRLRREIRVLGSVMMMVAPLAISVLLLRSLSTPTEAADRFTLDARVDPFSTESQALSPQVQRVPTIVFPGYLLPPDRGEDTTHEGG